MKKKQTIIVAVLALIFIAAGLLIFCRPKVQDGESTDKKQEDVEKQTKQEEGDKKNQDSSDTNKKATSDIRAWLEEDVEKEDSQFPYRISNTPLVIRAVKSYNGVFIEDGSDRDISGVATIIVDNKGEQYVEYAKLLLQCGNKELTFEVRTLAPGGTMIVQESNASPYTGKQYGACRAEVAYMNGMEMSEKQVKIWETEKGSLKIENISGQEIPSVRVFYKFYMDDLDVSVGGITYTSKIESLKEGEVREITPSHYQTGASKVMMVRTYDRK